MLVSSAQFSLVSKVNAPEDGDSWGISNFTNNWGVGYNVSDRIMVGAYKQGDNFDMFARYKMNFGYVCFEAPTADMADNMSIGYGMYIKVYENLSVNMSEVKRYLRQIISIVKYYRDLDEDTSKDE